MASDKPTLNERLAKSIRIFFYLFGIFSLLYLTGCDKLDTGVLHPKGTIAFQERQLLFDSLALMLIVVIPVIVMSFAFVIRYHAAHKTSDYKPNWGHNVLLEAIWWGVPCAIILVLGVITWIMTHKLDPYRPIFAKQKPLVIQAVALPWKWLFIYPKENIATVNSITVPKGKQVEFQITSDNVPMSAFAIPQMTSQIYAMAGMRTRVFMVALQTGVFQGLNAQYNGDGFSDMHFKVNVVAADEMAPWISSVKRATRKLDSTRYAELVKPAINFPVKFYSGVQSQLFNEIIKSHRKTEGYPTEWHYHPETP